MTRKDLLADIDPLAGPRRRSKFLIQAAREKVVRERLRTVAHEMAGSLREAQIQGWETPESTTAWIRSLREESDDRAFSRDNQE